MRAERLINQLIIQLKKYNYPHQDLFKRLAQAVVKKDKKDWNEEVKKGKHSQIEAAKNILVIKWLENI